jgi:pyridoxine 4-dehydrogenase
MTDLPSAAAAGRFALGGEREVVRLGFGAMRLCGPGVWGWPADRENALAVLRRAIELGVTLIDTADAYGPGVNEEQIAQALYPYPPELAIATKAGSTRSGPGQWGRDGRPERLRQCCEASLRRLRLDCIELYQLHSVDPKVPFSDQVGALRDLRDAGKIRFVGLSNVTLDQVRIAQGIVAIASVQNAYNVANRESEPILEHCEREGIAFLPYFPLDGGDIEANETLRAVARRLAASMWQVALAWLLEHSPVLLPIPGTSSIAHLEENVAAASLRLGKESALLEGEARPL